MLTTRSVSPPLMLFPILSCTPKRKLRKQRRTAYLRGLEELHWCNSGACTSCNFCNFVASCVTNDVSTWLHFAKMQLVLGRCVTQLQKLHSGKIGLLFVLFCRRNESVFQVMSRGVSNADASVCFKFLCVYLIQFHAPVVGHFGVDFWHAERLKFTLVW